MSRKSITQVVEDYGPIEALLHVGSAIEAVADLIDSDLDRETRDEYLEIVDALEDLIDTLPNPPALRQL